ncbi:MAG: tetraacyldisaccharide 4'-kinase [Pirellulales bacterium]|nr:tetraacyldisaccharide 4'-kinase [Pirellulales bacterium]HJN67596.1 tetraacyldisaccharide 4'-kinase [Pirellulales bacterium]
MLSSSTFRALVSGQACGLLATIARFGLSLAEIPYRWAVAYRNHRFDKGLRTVHDVGVPVISVGNLTLGGTGKTPTVELLATYFLENGVRIAIVSRGYGSSSREHNDEAMELSEKLPQVPHVQNPDRVAAATSAIEQHACQAILLDDGFQHRRLARDLDIVLIDALEPFGFNHVFPRGTLREPVSNIVRADAVALTRCELIDHEQREDIRQRIDSLAPNAVWLEITHHVESLLGADGRSDDPKSLDGEQIAAFCGIGNPQNFRRTIDSSCNWDLAGWREFPDHHRYDRQDVANLLDWLKTIRANVAVCTHKDLVKLRSIWPTDMKLYALTITSKILKGGDDLNCLLKPLIKRAATNS